MTTRPQLVDLELPAGYWAARHLIRDAFDGLVVNGDVLHLHPRCVRTALLDVADDVAATLTNSPPFRDLQAHRRVTFDPATRMGAVHVDASRVAPESVWPFTLFSGTSARVVNRALAQMTAKDGCDLNAVLRLPERALDRVWQVCDRGLLRTVLWTDRTTISGLISSVTTLDVLGDRDFDLACDLLEHGDGFGGAADLAAVVRSLPTR